MRPWIINHSKELDWLLVNENGVMAEFSTWLFCIYWFGNWICFPPCNKILVYQTVTLLIINLLIFSMQFVENKHRILLLFGDFFFLFIGWEPTMWPANDCLEFKCTTSILEVFLDFLRKCIHTNVKISRKFTVFWGSNYAGKCFGRCV